MKRLVPFLIAAIAIFFCSEFSAATATTKQPEKTTRAPMVTGMTTPAAAPAASSNTTGAANLTLVFVSGVPRDRTICDEFGQQLAQDEVLGEKARLLPASMRIRHGIFKMSAAAHTGIEPIFVNIDAINISSSSSSSSYLAPDSRGAHSLAASIAMALWQTNGTDTTSNQMRQNFVNADFWMREMPPITVRRQPFGINNNNELPTQPINVVPPSVFLRGLQRAAQLHLVEEEAGSSIVRIGQLLAGGRVPVVLMSGCRFFDLGDDDANPDNGGNTNNNGMSGSGSGNPTTTTTSAAPKPPRPQYNETQVNQSWPLVWGDPYEKYAVVVGVDLELVYVVFPSMVPGAAVAMGRGEFLMRWHHAAWFDETEQTSGGDNHKKDKYDGSNKNAFFPVQRWLASVARPVNGSLDLDGMFGGALEMLSRPPEVVKFDDVCR